MRKFSATKSESSNSVHAQEAQADYFLLVDPRLTPKGIAHTMEFKSQDQV